MFKKVVAVCASLRGGLRPTKQSILSFILMLVTSLGYAEGDAVQLMGTETLHLKAKHTLAATTSSPKTITLMALKLGESGKQIVLARPDMVDDNNANLPASIQLGMNGVPVLDQGRHGTCVTFASTAAVDAVLGKGDYISQLCQLELGNYLSTVGYQHSGWDGTWGHAVLNQMETFGIVSKEKQNSGACAQVTDYPLNDETTPETQMTPQDFHAISVNLAKKTNGWVSLLKVTEFSSGVNTQTVLNRVKTALNEGDRVVFGSLLLDLDLGTAGAVGHYHVENDTWVLSQKIKKDLETMEDVAGHEMVIIGYDDKAVAVDPDGATHTGLLIIRNSWGKNQGDRGNFYMSYEFFKTLVLEAHRIYSR